MTFVNVNVFGRPEKTWAFFTKASWITSYPSSTTTRLDTRYIVNTSPYLFASFLSGSRISDEPRNGKDPIRGKAGGPGGSFFHDSFVR